MGTFHLQTVCATPSQGFYKDLPSPHLITVKFETKSYLKDEDVNVSQFVDEGKQLTDIIGDTFRRGTTKVLLETVV
jgi:hypothetical protein